MNETAEGSKANMKKCNSISPNTYSRGNKVKKFMLKFFNKSFYIFDGKNFFNFKLPLKLNRFCITLNGIATYSCLKKCMKIKLYFAH